MSEDNISTNDLNTARLAHLTGLLSLGIGALFLWLIHKDMPGKTFVDKHAKEAINFQFAMLVGYFIASALVVILVGIILWLILIVMDVVCSIKAGNAAINGKDYRYPIS
ncbi:MAG: DUF4870 domain-containing protein, partial [Zoogloeaceae bacterium]|nr:DUF4870 domain-containing protein [Zoogloeaceae bacterium]